MTGTKRKYGRESPADVSSNKSRAKPTVEPRVDPTYGQRSALPGLDDESNLDGDDELNYDDQDALSYLRAVRQEATGIPNLLVAPKAYTEQNSRAIYENGVGDYRGWYEDGAYCAAPQESSRAPAVEGAEVEGEEMMDPQLAYFDSILARYEILRIQLQESPPAEAVEKLDNDHPTYLGRLNTETAKWWRWKMRAVDPVPAQIASMDKGTVLRLLGLLTTGTLLKRGAEVQVGISRWAWGLLARLPARGELTSEEIGVVRELGKKAVIVGMGLREEQQWEEGMEEVEAGFDEDYEDGEAIVNNEAIDLELDDGFDDSALEANKTTSGDRDINSQKIGPQLPTVSAAEAIKIQENTTDEARAPVFEELATAKARILQALNAAKAEEIVLDVEVQDEEAALAAQRSAARWNTKATVDMIITVAGEIYGQRDLLEFRQTWESLE